MVSYSTNQKGVGIAHEKISPKNHPYFSLMTMNQNKTKQAFRSRPRRVGGHGGGDAALGVSLGQTTAGADLGGSSKYSTQNAFNKLL